MPVSEKLSGLAGLSDIWDWSPLAVFVFLVAVDFGLVNLGMAWEGHFMRGRYLSFLMNDTLVLPLLGMVSVIMLRHSQAIPSLYAHRWYHWGVLGISFAVSIGLEVQAVKAGIYTIAEEMSPSKLTHTIVFGLMGYWVFAPLLAVLAASHASWPAFGIVGVCLVAFVMIVINDRVVYLTPDRTPPHVAGGWIPGTGKPRPT